MVSLPVVSSVAEPAAREPSPSKPAWLKIKMPLAGHFETVQGALRERGLVTVCEEALCPNQGECWNGGTATFMVLGDVCTRGCRFCSVSKAAKGRDADADEPRKLAQAIRSLNLKYAVITMVDRDDVPDQGAGHVAECIREAKRTNPGLRVEVLTGDFRGNEELLKIVLDANPDVFAHNVETVRELQGVVRDGRAGYEQSLGVLRAAKRLGARFTKTSLMLGLGETDEQLDAAFADARDAGVDFLTLGQYLRPSARQLPVKAFIPPERFNHYRERALRHGFAYVAAGPFVRSSYRAGELFVERALRNETHAV